MKQKFFNRALSAALAATLMAAMALPVSAGGHVNYEAKDGTSHTIRWADGIAVPEMESKEKKGSFRKTKVTLEGETFEVLEMPYRGAQGWFDLTEKPRKDEKTKKEVWNSGYAAAAANVTYWWLQQNQGYIGAYLESKPRQTLKLADPKKLYDLMAVPASQAAEESPVYALYQKHFPEDTQPDQLLDFFVNGYTGKENQMNVPENYKPHSQGGFFYPVFEKQILTDRSAVTLEKLRDTVSGNNGGILRLEKDGAVRYMNLWGVETDDSGKLCALYVTDSRDNLGLVRYEIRHGESMKLAEMTITGLYTLSLGEPTWEEAYPKANEKVPPLIPDSGEKPEAPEVPEETEKPEQPEQKPDIEWNKPTYVWSKDHKICTAKRSAKGNSDLVQIEEAMSVSEETRKPSHKKPGIMTYTAEFEADWAETQVTTREIPKTDLSWNAPTYEWDESLRICRAVRTAKEDPSIRETAETGVTSIESRAPTCKQKGQTTYRAEFEEDWAEPQEKVLENIEKLTPNWGATEYRWSQDLKTCTAVRVCKNESDGSHVETVSGKVTSQVTRKPTVSQKGETTYTAQFDADWASSQKKAAADIPVVAEQWEKPTYEWTENFGKCIATRVDKTDRNHVETVFAKVSSRRTKAPTAFAKGETTYTAVFDVNWAETQYKTVANIPTLPGGSSGSDSQQKPQQSQWNDPTYEWSEDHSKCSAKRTKKGSSGGGDVIWATVTKKELKAPTCAEKGEILYTAVFQDSWAKTQTLKVPVDALEHKLQKIEAVSATAAKEGMKEHYKCSECGKLFLDPEGKQEVRRDQLLISNPSVTDGYAILNAIPEKDHLVAVPADKFHRTMEDNPGAVGVSIAVGSTSVTYDKKDIENILSAAGDNQKLQLEIYKTDSTDSAMTPEQMQSSERNPQGALYMVQLSYVKNGKNVPIDDLTGSSVTVPYTGADTVKVYRVAEDGSYQLTEGSFRDSFVTFRGGNGLYLLTESSPSAEGPRKSGSKIGVIIWTSVLILSGLMCLGLAGFYLYQKKMEQMEVPEEKRPSGRPHAPAAAPVAEEPRQETTSEVPDFDMEELDRVLQDLEPEASAEPEAPAAPKGPSIAEKTADSVNSKHSKV